MSCAFTSIAENIVELRSIGFSYGEDGGSNGRSFGEGLFFDFSLSIGRGERVAIMGASGSGKSTLGRLLTGLLRSDTGWIYRHPDLEVAHNVVYIDQSPLNSVFPWQRVEQNIGYPLQKLGWPAEAARRRVDRLLRIFALQDVRHSYPAHISGGQLQRLALARCLSWRPRFAVLDETFSALDQRMKEDILLDLPALLEADGTTVVLITHSASDVRLITNRCVVLAGRPVAVVEDSPVGPAIREHDAVFDSEPVGSPELESIPHGIA